MASGLDHATVVHRLRLLSDNGSSYVAGDLARWLEDKGIEHLRGTPYHPQTQGKIERWHQTLKNRILLTRKHDDEVQLYAFDILALDGDDLRKLPLSMRKANLARRLARRPVSRLDQGEEPKSSVDR